MASERVVQFRIPKTNISYSMKLGYDDNRIIQSVERQEIRKSDRSVEFRMLQPQEKDMFVAHYRDKIRSLPIVRKQQ